MEVMRDSLSPAAQPLHMAAPRMARQPWKNQNLGVPFLLFLRLFFFGDFNLEEAHLCEVAVVIELVLDLARVVDERKIALQVFYWRVK